MRIRELIEQLEEIEKNLDGDVEVDVMIGAQQYRAVISVEETEDISDVKGITIFVED